MKVSKGVLFFLLVSLMTCKNDEASNTIASEVLLEDVIKAYETEREYDFEPKESLDNTIEFYQKEAGFAEELQQELSKVNEENLTESEQISLELLRFVLQEKIDANTFKTYLNTITSEWAFHLNLSKMAETEFEDYNDVKTYLEKLNELPKTVDYNLALLRESIKEGMVQPKVVFGDYSFTYNKHLVEDYTQSDFYQPINTLPQSLTSKQKDSVLSVAKISIENNVVAQYQKIKDFFEIEYFPNSREALGITSIPNGEAFYQNRINYFTTSNQYTAEDIHQIGLKEVVRIKAKMQVIIDELGFEGSFADFLAFLRTDSQFYAKTPKELMMFARDISKRIDGELPKYFKTLPRKPYGVVPVPAAIAPKYTGGRYSGSYDDKTAGFYWVNTYNLPSRTLYTIPALTAHEAVPGHHLQISLNNELGDSIPQYRRDLYLSAYGEGWGLYSEYLADEMGIYTTPYEKFGQLTYEMWRACRLVVDTGVHALGWTRQEVLDYLASNTALSIHEVTTETDRYISWPAQAISYKIGEIKIRELREKAETELQDKFDIREFHEVILGEGTVTLSIMEERVNSYIQAVNNE
ncbi:DUF885 domain-containing protein [Xanthomarina spongicola]|uniref:Uncharacterized protein (DUF885 family) n=1 Tax=Xanthomarina spongicola TaxID=570520 RepID=A0A316DL05_9FLAO|nr:DUF885 domain-containing protein [Xanthomarina spongicola]PWK18278.1 uncharacterized protein (DUF885 family) [Xanthomarina spongicola]